MTHSTSSTHDKAFGPIGSPIVQTDPNVQLSVISEVMSELDAFTNGYRVVASNLYDDRDITIAGIVLSVGTPNYDLSSTPQNQGALPRVVAAGGSITFPFDVLAYELDAQAPVTITLSGTRGIDNAPITQTLEAIVSLVDS